MTIERTQMRREVLEIPVAVDRLLHHGADEIGRAADAIRARSPAYMVSVARGSSDHVATYLKYVSELLTGTPIASIGPSIASIYKRKLNLEGSVCLSVSQSGKSPDIVEMARMARSGGALSIAMTNHSDSPLAQVADHTLNLHAGPEISVAATKTFVNSAVAGIWLLAEWAEDDALRAAIHELPQKLESAVHTDWPEARAALEGRNSIFCLGRGPASAISNEAALKFKETCQIHAESYSSAEVLHGPVSIVDGGFPVIALAAQDEAETALAGVADELAAKGATVFATSPTVRHATPLPAIRTGHALTDPITLIASFYAMVERTAASRGINPDAPRHLKKVTETI
ncbi:Glutamine--fructose-6-phosphate aminotransferase [isomerizing] [Roseobacter fucihabitans]|uniref:Glutamine--fructose-6-phosphate aminotransferase [isomerizing] n=1 Tax=Roseobacter fucihabitans TaxID=1537242 RepID=A0ABZ2BPJ9_9RHOB|nr:SIS domain-containing protein [Roseobacter litoralis]MBC6965365.1 Glutamine--fructose-6-phosphate aminotransferase (isomerizing) [Roseobacter litoralis]MBC6965469.1 Glutamine--fructose-6-phosphate aminotransferase (isomerizing) [Roseobacter litoralis]